MGGSGGSYFVGSSKPDDVSRKLRESEAANRDALYEANVGELMTGQLALFNARDVSGTQAILEKVKRDLKSEIGGTVDLVFGGSVAKHTYVDGLSDVDALVLLNPSDIARKSPGKLKALFAEKLEERFGKAAVKEGTLAVTLSLDGKTIQLLPAMREGDQFRIPGPKGVGWSTIDPRKFAEKLTGANQKLDGKLVPTLKLVKSIISSFPEQRQLSGYHTEALALEVFKSYTGPRTPKDMLGWFFGKASERVRSPISDITGQSNYLDAYLGGKDSLERRIASDALSRVARQIQNADGAKSVNMWRDILEGT